MVKKSFGKFLKEKRQEMNLTLKDLANMTGISSSYLSRIERGQRGTPSAALLKKICTPLGLKQEDIFVAAGYLEKSNSNYSSCNSGDSGREIVNDPGTNELWEEMQDLNHEEKKSLLYYLKAIKLQRQEKHVNNK